MKTRIQLLLGQPHAMLHRSYYVRTPLFNAVFLSILSEYHLLPETRFFGQRLRCRQYGYILTHCDVIGYHFVMWYKVYFEKLNSLGMTHECDRRTDRQTDRLTHIMYLSVCMSESVYVSLCMSVYPSVCMCVCMCLCVCLCVCVRAAAMTLRTVLLSLQALLSAAEPDDPQDAVVAKQYKEQPEMFRRTARHWANTYAGGLSLFPAPFFEFHSFWDKKFPGWH